MRITEQRTDGDCGLAALSTLTGQSYEDVYVACARVERVARGRLGLTLDDLIQTAAKLGVTLARKRRPDLDEDDGILSLTWIEKRKYRGHYVVLRNGLVIDGKTVMPVDEYLVTEQAKPGHLLMEIR